MIHTLIAVSLLGQVGAPKLIQGARVLALAAGPKGSQFAATMEDGSVKIFDAATRMTLKTLGKHPQPAYALAWSKDGAWLASGDESARIYVWDTRTGKKISEMRTHTKGVQALDFNGPRTLLLSTGKDDTVKLYPMPTGKEATIPGKGANFYGAHFMGMTSDFGVGTLGVGSRIYNSTGKVKGFLTGHDNQGVFEIGFNQNFSRAVTGGKDGTAAIWDVKSFKRLNSLRGHGDWVVHCAFSPSGKWVATSSSDRTVRVWDVNTYKQIGLIDNQSSIGSPLCFTDDGKFLVTASGDDTIQINPLSPAQPSGPAPKPPKASKTKKRKGGGQE